MGLNDCRVPHCLRAVVVLDLDDGQEFVAARIDYGEVRPDGILSSAGSEHGLIYHAGRRVTQTLNEILTESALPL
jgi:hypothetical protein